MGKSGTSSNKDVTTLKSGVNIYGPSAMERLKEATSVASFIRKRLQEEAVEGNTTEALEKLADSLLKEHHCDPLFQGHSGYPYITCMSNNKDIVHGFPNKTPLQKGDVLSIDIGLRHSNGFCADNARTVIVGGLEGSPHRELVELGRRAYLAGLEKAHVGNTAADIGNSIFKEIVRKRVEGNRKASVYKIFDRFRGHGIGLELHEDPSIPNWGAPGCGHPLVHGMCICIEPVILYNSSKVLMKSTNSVPRYFSHNDLPSTHHENQILITKDGPIVLT